jgi:hypothetical protein
LRAVARFVESLKAGFEHGRTIAVSAARATQLGAQNGSKPVVLIQNCALQYFRRIRDVVMTEILSNLCRIYEAYMHCCAVFEGAESFMLQRNSQGRKP